ncbi:MAG: tetratricopeptide repeat protein [Desulfobacteraceae bacterium]|nr:tetratricopeptide repeat protein [Desulfobacteraceae bacterium]
MTEKKMHTFVLEHKTGSGNLESKKHGETGSNSESEMLYKLALLAVERDETCYAIGLIKRALVICPGNALYLRALAELLIMESCYAEALSALENALAIEPDVEQIYFLMGIATDHCGDITKSVESYQKAVELDPDWHEARYNLAIARHRAGDIAGAIVDLNHILTRKPDWAAAWLNLGRVYSDIGDHPQAMQCWQKALLLEPDNYKALFNMATCLYAQAKFDEAIGKFNSTLKREPQMAKAWYGKGKCYYDLKKTDKAAQCYHMAITIEPDYAMAWFALAATFQIPEQLEDVVACYRKVIDLEPKNDAAQLNFAMALRKQGQIQGAMIHCRKALAITPRFTKALIFLFQLAQHACDWRLIQAMTAQLDELLEDQLAKKITPDESPMLNLRRKSDPRWNLEVARAWSRAAEKSVKQTPAPLMKPARKGACANLLRIGYISSDLKEHAVAHPLRGLFRCHDRTRFEITAFACNAPDRSHYQKEMKKVSDHFFHIHHLTNTKAAGFICEHGIDILVDLTGHSQGRRMEILARRPAPILVSYLGFLGTSGADFIDYLITDAIVTPPDHADFYTEKLVYMPQCYQVNDNTMPLPKPIFRRGDFGLDENSIVFCSFNQPYKLDQATFECWLAILSKTSESVLWLLYQNASARDNMRKAAQNAGIDPDRLKFGDPLRIDKHICRLTLADIALDPFAYNGGATTSNALWAGIPVVTKTGGHFVSRMSASALNAVGLNSLIAQNAEDYQHLAVELAANASKRTEIRRHLCQNRHTLPLFDTSLFTVQLEKAFTYMYHRHANQLPPVSFKVEPDKV